MVVFSCWPLRTSFCTNGYNSCRVLKQWRSVNVRYYRRFYIQHTYLAEVYCGELWHFTHGLLCDLLCNFGYYVIIVLTHEEYLLQFCDRCMFIKNVLFCIITCYLFFSAQKICFKLTMRICFEVRWPLVLDLAQHHFLFCNSLSRFNFKI